MIPAPIILTEEAANHIKAKTQGKEGAIGLRLSIVTTGCSGNSYKMGYVLDGDDVSADDLVQYQGANLYVPKIHSWMLIGMTIDYEKNSVRQGFTFNNPNEQARCGCGESFTI